MPSTDAIQVTGVMTVGIPVTDQDRALDFYVGVLGLQKRIDAPTPGGGRWVDVVPAGARAGTTTIALIKTREGLSAGVDTGVRLATTDADAAHARLVEAGLQVDEVLRWPGVPAMFSFRDRDGNTLEMIEEPRG